MTLYFDTSVIVSLFLDEPRGKTVAAAIADEEAFAISDLLVGEFGAAVATAVRAQRLSLADAGRVYDVFDRWIGEKAIRVNIEPSALRAAGQWVRRPEFTLLFPDALHIAICQSAGARLMTSDKQQAHAAAALGAQIEFID